MVTELGYCCGKKRHNPQNFLRCTGKDNNNCQVEKDTNYYIYEVVSKNPISIVYCAQCFNQYQNDYITFMLSDSTKMLVYKSAFIL